MKNDDAFVMLAASAPPVPDWFQPEIGPKPELPSHYDVLTPEERDEWRAIGRRGLDETLLAAASAPVREFAERLKAASQVRNDWLLENERERTFQWPLYYANELCARMTGVTTT